MNSNLNQVSDFINKLHPPYCVYWFFPQEHFIPLASTELAEAKKRCLQFFSVFNLPQIFFCSEDECLSLPQINQK